MRPRLVALLALLAVVVAGVAVALVSGTGDDPPAHRVYAIVDEADNVIPGQEIRDAAGPVGRVAAISAIDHGRRARITLEIDEQRAWPLRRGTRMTVRFGGTAAFFNRYVWLEPGPSGSAPIPNAEDLRAGAFHVPVEIDSFVGTFDAPARRDLKALVDHSGAALGNARPGLSATLSKAPPVLDEADAVLRGVAADSAALDTLLTSADRVVDAVHRSDPGLATLVQGAAQTFGAIADRQAGLRSTLQRLPGALQQIQRTLPVVDHTLRDAADLTDRLAPGVAELRRTAAPLDGVLTAVRQVAPDARATLSTVRDSGSSISAFLRTATEDAPQLTSLFRQANDQLDCLRPYTPEIVNLLTTWGDWMSVVDENDRYLRAQIQNFLPASMNSLPYDAATAKKLFPGLRYGFPRPPGYLAGQPWYLPECGAGKDAVDPSKDQESRNFPADERIPASRRAGG